MLKIARIIARLNVGGPAVQAVLMTKEFQSRGYESQLFAGEVPTDEQTAEYLADEHGVVVRRIGGLSRKISWTRDLRSLVTLVRLFRSYRPDVVHTHTAKAGALGRVAALITGVPIRIHTFHGHVFDGYFSPPVTRAFVWIERVLARFTDRIIAISELQKRDLIYKYKIASAEKVVCIPLGFDMARYLSLPASSQGGFRGELGFGGDHFLVGWVGRLTEIKNPLAFIDMAEIVSRQCPNTRFVMLGDGNLHYEIATAIRAQGLSDRVRLYGISRDPLRVYADIDLLTVTSRNEGTPLAMLEAMASGRAIVATDVGGVRDLMFGEGVVSDAGTRFNNGFVTAQDVNKLADGVKFYADNPLAAKAAGLAGREWVRDRFSHHRLADDLETLYTEVAIQKGRFPIAANSNQDVQKAIPANVRRLAPKSSRLS